MAKTPKEPKGEKAPKKEKAPKVKGRLLDKVTNLTVVLFAVSLAAEKLVGG